MQLKTITDFLSNEYKEFAFYTIENRALPSLIDGFKISQRKIINASCNVWKTGSEKHLKVFQLSGIVASTQFYHHGDCLDPETEIILSDGSVIKLIDWFNNFPEKKINLVSYDETSDKFCESIGHSPRVGNVTREEMQIELENGEIVKCTTNHPFLTQRGWINAESLTDQDEIKSFTHILLKVRIKSVKKVILDDEKKFYDITVDKYHNFLINKNSMVVTHNSSLNSAVINLAQKFKNNVPLLEEDGQFGSLRSPQAGAPRYIGTKLSLNFRLIYKDFELLEYKEEEGEKIEPTYFLPIVPTVLVNGGSGIAVGFASNILNRDLKELISVCVKYLKDGKISKISPFLQGFTGEYIQDVDNPKKWHIRGKFEKVNTTTVKITELPPSMTYEKYEEVLDKLVDNKDIVSYDDNCKDNIDYTIKFTRSELESHDTEKLYKLLKLEENETENFNTLDENGKLKIFESVEEIIKYFVDFRLTYYQKRKDYQISKLQSELKLLGNRGKFIKCVLDGKIEINNKAKDDIIVQIEENSIEKIDDSYDYLLRMPIYSLTKEMFEKLKSEFTSKKEEIEKLKSIDPKGLYLADLNELKQKIK
jgi:DNA gyrase/topoisomerase IV subunit A